MMSVSRLAICVLIVMCATAAAGTRTTIAFSQDTSACESRTATTDEERSTVEVSIVEGGPPGKEAAARKEIPVRVERDGKELGKATVKAKSTKLDPPVTFASGAGATIVRVGDEKTSCNFIIAASASPQPSDPRPGDPRPGDPKSSDPKSASIVEAARQYLSQQNILDHERTGGWRGHTYKLYHLPDGSPAFPLPNRIAEEDRVELWIVAVAGEAATAEITTCNEVPVARISGASLSEQAQPIKSGEGIRDGAAEPPAFQLRSVAPSSRCAEQLSYKLGSRHGQQEISIKIAPVHLFAWGLAYGFDFGRPTRLSLVERPVAGGAGETERVIVSERDSAGLRPMVTLTLNACRANLQDWDLCDAIGLTAMVDPGRLAEGGGLGLKLQPYPGLGVLIGLTFFQVDTFQAGHALQVGDVFGPAGELPIDKDFTRKSLGLFLGFGGDTETVKKLF
jgi:hypothetical protein